jgi:hypothetical protein
MSFSRVEYGDFFERRGREGCAESAEEVKEKNTKLRKFKAKKITKNFIFDAVLKTFEKAFFLDFPFLPSILRPLRNLRVLCVQKLPASLANATSPLTEGAA